MAHMSVYFSPRSSKHYHRIFLLSLSLFNLILGDTLSSAIKLLYWAAHSINIIHIKTIVGFHHKFASSWKWFSGKRLAALQAFFEQLSCTLKYANKMVPNKTFPIDWEKKLPLPPNNKICFRYDWYILILLIGLEKMSLILIEGLILIY